jgi:hypothetical protein
MQNTGNCIADQIYGSEKISPDASKETKQLFVTNKYEKLLFAPAKLSTPAAKGTSVVPPATVAASKAESIVCVSVHAGRCQRKTSHPVKSTGSATLLTSMPTSAIAKKTDISDDLFDELFGDWTTPVHSKQIPAVDILELPSDLFQDVGKNIRSAATEQETRSQKAQTIAEPQDPKRGALIDLDDIFAELNKL